MMIEPIGELDRHCWLRAGRNLLTRWTQRVSFETSRIASDGRSRREMAPQQLEKIESKPGNGRVSEARSHKIWYTGAQVTARSD